VADEAAVGRVEVVIGEAGFLMVTVPDLAPGVGAVVLGRGTGLTGLTGRTGVMGRTGVGAPGRACSLFSALILACKSFSYLVVVGSLGRKGGTGEDSSRRRRVSAAKIRTMAKIPNPAPSKRTGKEVVLGKKLAKRSNKVFPPFSEVGVGVELGRTAADGRTELVGLPEGRAEPEGVV
jgi:hypothetical protein